MTISRLGAGTSGLGHESVGVLILATAAAAFVGESAGQAAYKGPAVPLGVPAAVIDGAEVLPDDLVIADLDGN